jgi:very-long-chain enoyl-CoA reductase
MPIFNLYKNCAYYWGFTLLVAYPLAHPQYTAPGAAQVAVGAALWLVSQALNLAVHLQLAGMRGAEGDDSRQPPGGWLFSLVTSPNYTTEALAWVGWSLVSNVAMGYVFTLAGLAQMAQWSLQKYRGYKESGDSKGKEYAQRRKAIIPFVL